MKKIQHVMIRASAGSGKTYQLTNRFIELLVCGQLPERISRRIFRGNTDKAGRSRAGHKGGKETGRRHRNAGHLASHVWGSVAHVGRRHGTAFIGHHR